MENKKKKYRKNSLTLPIILFILLYLICSMALASVIGSYEADFSVGSISSRTITAPEDFTDEYSTSIKREEAKQKVLPCYSIDKAVMLEAVGKLESDLAFIEEVRASSEDAFIKYYDELGIQTSSFNPGSVRWESILGSSAIRSKLSSAPEYFTEESISVCSSFDKAELEALRQLVSDKINERYSGGVIAEEIPAILEDIRKSLREKVSLTVSQLTFAMTVVENNFRANKVYDQTATETAKENAAMSVEAVVYKKNQNIIQKGEIITQAQFEILKQIGFSADAKTSTPKKIAAFAVTSILFLIAFAYLYVNDKDMLLDSKSLISLFLLVSLGVVPTLLLRNYDSRICLVFLPVIIGATTLKRRISFAFAVFMSVLLGILQSSATDFIFSVVIMRYILAGLAGSFICVTVLKKQHRRREYVWAGLTAGIACSAVYAVYCVLTAATGTQMAESISIGLACGIVCGLLSVGTLPVWEAMFSIATPSRLLELCDPGSELLRRITYDIPGTYHHSVLMGNLAEAACDAIGANSLLVRVSSYYHDTGKLLHPTMFKENQLHIANAHDNLSPEESAKIIISHVSDGVDIARGYKLPKQVTDIIQQHHGTSLVAYFYNKALNEEAAPAEIDFRYPGPKPQTKEAGVLMLADTVEAAVRANELRDISEIRAFIDKLIQGKINDGQLDECPISFKDIVSIKNAFINVYEGANHERIRYPGDKTANKQ